MFGFLKTPVEDPVISDAAPARVMSPTSQDVTEHLTLVVTMAISVAASRTAQYRLVVVVSSDCSLCACIGDAVLIPLLTDTMAPTSIVFTSFTKNEA